MPVEVAPGCGVAAVAPGLHLPTSSRLSRRELTGERPADQGSFPAAVFLDRDGVLIKDIHYLRTSSEVELLPGIGPPLRSLQECHYLIVATNQSGIARGYFSEGDLLSIHAEILHQLAMLGVLIDAFYYCPHLEGCNCRKPAAGMLYRASTEWSIDLARSALIGDAPRDVEAGRSAGLLQTILLGLEMDLTRAARCILGGLA
jgi:D-glycero-D-manno-heptose 1,7-bisphosphate phosphatase